LHNDSKRGPVIRRVSSQAQRFCFQTSRNSLSHTASRNQYRACQPAASVSFRRQQWTPPASAEDGNDMKRRRKPSLNPWSTSDFPVLASRSTTSTHIRKCRQAQDKSGRCGRHVCSGRSAVPQHEQIEGALTPRHRGKYQDCNKQYRGEAAFVTIRSIHFYGISNGYHPSFLNYQNQRASSVGRS
jgi:hypothetical protein